MKKILNIVLLLVTALGFSQKKDHALPRGNSEYVKKNYINAEADFRISQSNSPKKATAAYNLGNSIYKQKASSEAKGAYLKAINSATTRTEKHRAFHNLGNVMMNEKNYSAAVEAYKNALRNNPDDEETRYNYAMAKKFLKDNPPPKDDKNKDKKDDKKDKEKKDDKKKGDDEKDKKQNDPEKEKDKEGEGNKDKPQENGQPKPRPGGISKERLENLLEAVNNEEKKIQQKVNAKKVKGKPVNTEKDW